MKRSEMIDIIEDEIRCGIDDHEVSLTIAERVADRIENAGMLPPITIDGSSPISIVYLNECIKDMDLECKWRDESE